MKQAQNGQFRPAKRLTLARKGQLSRFARVWKLWAPRRPPDAWQDARNSGADLGLT